MILNVHEYPTTSHKHVIVDFLTGTVALSIYKKHEHTHTCTHLRLGILSSDYIMRQSINKRHTSKNETSNEGKKNPLR